MARINSNYVVYSSIKASDETYYTESGLIDVRNLIINDHFLKSKIDFNSISILEIGSGNGRMTEFIAKNFRHVYAADISKFMIDLARQRLKNLKNIEFIITNGSHLPIASEIIDLVFSYIVFQHFPTKKMVIENLREIKRVLKNNGLAKIQFRGRPASGGIFKVLKWYYGVYFSENELKTILTKLGLKPIKIYKTNEKELWAIFAKQ